MRCSVWAIIVMLSVHRWSLRAYKARRVSGAKVRVLSVESAYVVNCGKVRKRVGSIRIVSVEKAPRWAPLSVCPIVWHHPVSTQPDSSDFQIHQLRPSTQTAPTRHIKTCYVMIRILYEYVIPYHIMPHNSSSYYILHIMYCIHIYNTRAKHATYNTSYHVMSCHTVSGGSCGDLNQQRSILNWQVAQNPAEYVFMRPFKLRKAWKMRA